MVHQVFTAEAMATCAERGHAWRTVRTWHAVAHQECRRCGETPPFGSGYQFATCVTDWSNHDLQSISVGSVRSAAVARPSRAVAEPRPSRDADATDSIVIRAGALDGLAELPPGRIERLKAKRASPTGRSWGATAEQRRVRDEDIARRAAAGEERKAIALSHDIHPSRIAQILHALKQTKPAPSDHSARDAEIRRRRDAGDAAEAVAAAFGISVARVYQIAPRTRTEDHS